MSNPSNRNSPYSSDLEVYNRGLEILSNTKLTIRLWTDFNARQGLHTRFEGGRVPIWIGTIRDISGPNVELREGMHVIVSDDECIAEAIVENVEGEWWGRIIGPIGWLPKE